jgi:outer membrane receptor for ferrienterochelin and colicins
MGRLDVWRICRGFLAAGLVLACVCANARADERASRLDREISGQVLDSSGAVLPAVTLSLRSAVTGFERVATSDSRGRFAFTGVGAGDYVVAASLAGFAREIRTVAAAETAPLLLTLRPAPVVEEVAVVSGSRQAELRMSLNAKVDVVSRERIRDTGYETVGEVLRELPGVVTRRGSETAGAAGEQVQGIDSRQVLVLIDGQPLLGARGIKRGTLNLDRQSVGRLDRVEVVKGTSSALYGSDAIGGVINLVTREPERELEGALALSGGNRGTLDVRGEAGAAREHVSAFAFVQRHANDGFDLTPNTPDTTGPEEGRTDVFAKVQVRPSDRLAIAALTNGYWNSASGRVVGEEGLQTSEIAEDSQSFGLTLDWQQSPRTSLQARGYFSRFDEVSDGALVATNRTLARGELYERLGKADVGVSRIVGSRQQLQAGVEFWWNEYSGVNRLRDELGGNSVTTRVLWAQDRLQLGRRVTLTLGGRFDDHSAFGSAFSPKVAVNARAAEGLRLRASYGKGFRPPDLGQLYYRFLNPTNIYQVIGNPALGPEHATSIQLGAELAPRNGRARLGVNLFRNRVRDLIESVSLGFIATPAQLQAVTAREGIDASFRPVFGRLLFFHKNIRDAETRGLELDGEAALGRGISLAGAYTYMEAEDARSALALTNRSPHHGFARLAFENGRLGLRANLRGTFMSSWIASRTASAAGVVETKAQGFHVFDLYAAKRVVSGLEVYAAVDNLTGEQDPNVGLTSASGQPLPIYWPEAGRSYRAGVRLAFDRGSDARRSQ